MFGLNSGIDGKILYLIGKLSLTHFIQLRSRYRLVWGCDDSKLHGYGGSRIPVITGDHDRPDSGLTAFLDCRLNFRPYRINHSGETDKNKPAFQGRRGGILRFQLRLFKSACEYPERFICHFLVFRLNPFSVFLRHRTDCPVFPDRGTAF